MTRTIDQAVVPALRKSVNPPLLFWMGMKMLAGVGIVAMPVLLCFQRDRKGRRLKAACEHEGAEREQKRGRHRRRANFQELNSRTGFALPLQRNQPENGRK